MAGGSSSTPWAGLLAAWLGWNAGFARVAPASPPAASEGSPPAPAPELFTTGQVRCLRIELSADALQSLRDAPRVYVRALVREGDRAYPDTGLHLKGRSGSFRSVAEKPGLTLSFDRFSPSQRFHGHTKIHLNNSVEDPSYLNEYLGAELFRVAGVPAPRVTHALVELNGRKLGLYVLKEGFTREFLAQHFRRTDGSLYENDPGSGPPGRMRRQFGIDHEAELKELAAVAQEPDFAKRRQRLQRILDVDRFLSFMAIEVMTGHRDGYCLARNNFRMYYDPDGDRFVFLPQGLDQLFGRADLPLRARLAGPVASAVMEMPQSRRDFRERVAALYTNVFKVDELTRRADELLAQLLPALDKDAADEVERQATLVKQRIALRAANLAKQLSEPEATPPRFEQGVARLTNWRAVDVPAAGKLEQVNTPDGRRALRIRAEGTTGASWRTTVLLEAGRYRFEGLARTVSVEPLAFGKNKGAGLRVSEAEGHRPYQLTGDSPWTLLVVEFAATAPQSEVELLCELRARQGDAWFDLESLRLVRQK